MCHLPVCAMVRLLFVRAMLSDLLVTEWSMGVPTMVPNCLTVVCHCTALDTYLERATDSICNRTMNRTELPTHWQDPLS